MPFPAQEHPPPKSIAVLWTVVWLALAVFCTFIIMATDAPWWGKAVFLLFAVFSWIMALLGIDYYKEADK